MAEITWIGHSGFIVKTEALTVVFDPWVSGNPKSPLKSPVEVEAADVVFVSHDHGDHGYDDAIAICKHTGAAFVAVNELGIAAEEEGVEVFRGNLGGEIHVRGVRVHFAHAFHSCNLGSPCGFVVQLPRITVYHAGDTSLFRDMELLSRTYDIDVALLPIGSTFTMGPKEAAWAVEMLRPKLAIPMHYGTFPQVEQDPEEFKRLVGEKAEVIILVPGEPLGI